MVAVGTETRNDDEAERIIFSNPSLYVAELADTAYLNRPRGCGTTIETGHGV